MPLVEDAAASKHRFAGPFGEITLHVCRPEQRDAGGVIFFPGDYDPRDFPATHARGSELAAGARCTVLLVESALLRAPKFPRSLDEAYFITCFLHEHADELGLDHRKLAIGGERFGATLATTVARLAKERRNPELIFQLLLFPVLDLRAPSPELEELVESYVAHEADRRDPRACPVLAKNLIGLPSALILAAESQRAEAETYLAALTKAYVPATLTFTKAAAALPQAAAALRQALSS